MTGTIHNGKTSALLNLTSKFQAVDGILCPDIDDFRYVKFLSDGKLKKMQLSEVNENSISIGKYIFDSRVMKEVSDYLSNLKDLNDHLIIIDEIGKLELRNEGFEPGITHIVENYKKSVKTSKLLLVVRDYLVDEVITKYQLDDVCILNIDDLDSLLN